MRPLVANWWLPVVLLALLPVGAWLEAQPEAMPWFSRWLPQAARVPEYWVRVIVLLGINIVLAISLQLINGIAGQFSLGHAGFMGVGAYLGGYAVLAFGSTKNEAGDVTDFANPFGVLGYFGVWAGMLAGLLVACGAVWLIVRQLNRLWPATGKWLAAIAVLLAAADVLNLWSFKPATYLTLSAAALFQNLLAGMMPFATVMSGWLPAESAKPMAFFFAIMGGGFMAAAAGLVVGLPTLRLRGDYLAIATLGFAEIIRVVILNSEPLGRATGLSVPVYFASADPEYGITPAYIFPWVYGAVLITWLAVWRLQHSPRGRALQCVREDEIAAAAVGINVTSHKVLAFVFGAFFAGVAGVLYAHYEGYVNPQNFTMTRSIEIVVFVTLGGLGSIRGAVIATILLTVVQSGLQTAKSWMPEWAPPQAITVAESMNQYRPVIYALLLVVFMLARSRSWNIMRRKAGAA